MQRACSVCIVYPYSVCVNGVTKLVEAGIKGMTITTENNTFFTD